MFPAGRSTAIGDVNQSRPRREDERDRRQRAQQLDRPRIRRRRGACESCKHKKTKCTCSDLYVLNDVLYLSILSSISGCGGLRHGATPSAPLSCGKDVRF
jgi:hypothetical protein